MKKILLILFCLMTTQIFSQVNVGSTEIFRPGGPGKISKEKFDALKKTTTIFTLQFKDYDNLKMWQDAISQVWTLTPFKVISPEELSQYADKPGYSFFTFGGYMIQRQGSGAMNHVSVHLSYDFWMPNLKKPKKDRWLFSKISIYVDPETNNAAMGGKGKFSERITQQLYNDAVIHSWGPGFLMGYLNEINEYLMSDKTKHNLKEVRHKELLAPLRNDTLYVPDYVTLRTGMFYGIQRKDDDKDEELRDAYKYPIRILPAEELNKMIVYGERPIKYLVYIRSTSQHWINVYDSGTHRLLYSDERSLGISYNFKNKDLRRLARAID